MNKSEEQKDLEQDLYDAETSLSDDLQELRDVTTNITNSTIRINEARKALRDFFNDKNALSSEPN